MLITSVRESDACQKKRGSVHETYRKTFWTFLLAKCKKEKNPLSVLKGKKSFSWGEIRKWFSWFGGNDAWKLFSRMTSTSSIFWVLLLVKKIFICHKRCDIKKSIYILHWYPLQKYFWFRENSHLTRNILKWNGAPIKIGKYDKPLSIGRNMIFSFHKMLHSRENDFYYKK